MTFLEPVLTLGMSSSIPFGVIDKVEIPQVHITIVLLKVMGRDAGHIALNAGSGAGAGDSYP
jgi:6-phosphofructokinase